MTLKKLWQSLRIIPDFHTSLKPLKVGRKFRNQSFAHVLWKYGLWSVTTSAGLGLTLVAPFAFLIIFPLTYAIDSFGSRLLDPIFLPKGKRTYTVIEKDKTKKDKKFKVQYDDGTTTWMDQIF
jgi:hypothetical protein